MRKTFNNIFYILLGVMKMFKNRWLRDRRGIEGLPMHLIIIVVIAGVVIAAILAMMGMINPKDSFQVEYAGTIGRHNCDDGSGNLVKVTAAGAEEVTDIDFTATIKVFDSKGNPVQGATVVLAGAQSAGSGTTNENGEATVQVDDAVLRANQQQAYMSLTVKASGFHDYKDEEAILLQRT